MIARSVGAYSVIAAVSLLAGLAAAPALAQPSEARRLFEQGIRAAEEGRFGDAVLRFEASTELVPRASTYFNLAIALDRSGRPRDALDALARFFDVAAPDDPGLGEAAALRDEVRGRVVRLHLTVEPPDARVEIDGVTRPGAGATRELILDPGEHALALRAGGHEEARRTVRGGAGDEIAMTVALEATTRPAEASPIATEGTFGVLGVVGIALDGLALASGVGALVTGVLAADRHASLEQACGPLGDACPAGSEGDIEDGRALAWASTGLTIVAGVAAATGVTLLVLELTDATEPTAASLHLTPGGLDVRGRF